MKEMKKRVSIERVELFSNLNKIHHDRKNVITQLTYAGLEIVMQGKVGGHVDVMQPSGCPQAVNRTGGCQVIIRWS